MGVVRWPRKLIDVSVIRHCDGKSTFLKFAISKYCKGHRKLFERYIGATASGLSKIYKGEQYISVVYHSNPFFQRSFNYFSMSQPEQGINNSLPVRPSTPTSPRRPSQFWLENPSWIGAYTCWFLHPTKVAHFEQMAAWIPPTFTQLVGRSTMPEQELVTAPFHLPHPDLYLLSHRKCGYLTPILLVLRLNQVFGFLYVP